MQLQTEHQLDGIDVDEDVEFSRSCPSLDFLFPHEKHRLKEETQSSPEFANSLRSPLANVVLDKCPSKKTVKRKLFASEFQNGNLEHLKMIKNMGITIMSLPDGRVQLLHTHANVSIKKVGIRIFSS